MLAAELNDPELVGSLLFPTTVSESLTATGMEWINANMGGRLLNDRGGLTVNNPFGKFHFCVSLREKRTFLQSPSSLFAIVCCAGTLGTKNPLFLFYVFVPFRCPLLVHFSPLRTTAADALWNVTRWVTSGLMPPSVLNRDDTSIASLFRSCRSVFMRNWGIYGQVMASEGMRCRNQNASMAMTHLPSGGIRGAWGWAYAIRLKTRSFSASPILHSFITSLPSLMCYQ